MECSFFGNGGMSDICRKMFRESPKPTEKVYGQSALWIMYNNLRKLKTA